MESDTSIAGGQASIAGGQAGHELPGNPGEGLTEGGVVEIRLLMAGGVADTAAGIRAVIAEHDEVVAGQDADVVGDGERPVPEDGQALDGRVLGEMLGLAVELALKMPAVVASDVDVQFAAAGGDVLEPHHSPATVAACLHSSVCLPDVVADLPGAGGGAAGKVPAYALP
ncbi:hypothetical protein ACIBQX_33855 [Nonomuraea sp. NPDC049714]|uniref:hypothetical protein n=1 Tax=Nonomuraea sp. NPDC049714 TaxID=3364357 RepID=UPI0037ACC97B